MSSTTPAATPPGPHEQEDGFASPPLHAKGHSPVKMAPPAPVKKQPFLRRRPADGEDSSPSMSHAKRKIEFEALKWLKEGLKPKRGAKTAEV
eukprot:CAMPEP_0172041472 /NCGR_PEP_ID=MMETSP1041-20130122/25083_1 /TAXON_ID=464988 /ORGANISM="Hemiselmis andersenii, Strain CCMP439" /LENGTH=91 /DNA_ID=CAMNT_0012699505 /DNA_START=280 /DNA_END=556 /DNA_ORIENTATION=-